MIFRISALWVKWQAPGASFSESKRRDEDRAARVAVLETGAKFDELLFSLYFRLNVIPAPLSSASARQE